MITFGSLFAGIGGFDLGFERAEMTCRWQVEIDDYATKVLERHWPNVHRERDIRECGKHNLERVDVICGGFPCQDISYAGLGAGLDGERSGLFFEAIRVVRELRPRVVVLENVAALLTRGLDRVLGTLAEVGFDAEWNCIPAAAVGAPHIRDRVFVLAYRTKHGRAKRQSHSGGGKSGVDSPPEQRPWNGSGFDVANSSDNGAGWRKQLKEICQGEGNVADAKGQRLAKRKGYCGSNEKQSRSECSRVFGIESAGLWDAEPAMGELVNGVSGRLVRFAGRTAYGIPNRVNKLRGLGNAVVPQVAEIIGRQVVSALGGRQDGG